jgi:malonate-semialdehyde dehydrogenase (acetylating)/methylmalonate-semialdehyde dehydrogenase
MSGCERTGSVMRTVEHVIGGKNVAVAAARTLPVFDPATGAQAAAVGVADAALVDRAVSTAAEAAVDWSSASTAARAQVMFRFRSVLEERRGELARIITSEHGKVLSDAAGEISRALETVEFATGIPTHLGGRFSDQAATGIDVHELRQPIGVVTGISPFNFPVMVPMWMAAPAIACGNAFVLKPSERDPSAANLLAEMWSEAGLPEGVFNVVHGDAETVGHLIDHPTVAAVSFIGSTPVARAIYERAAAHGKRVQALGGAKNHMVVLPDADVHEAADAAVSAAFGSAGQRCMAISVVVAVGDVADSLVSEIVTRARTLRAGSGHDEASDFGPLITQQARDRVASYVADAETAGASIALDGRDAEVPSSGFFIGPTVVDHVRPEMKVYQDEVFGPLLCVVRASDLSDALAVVNANPYGNGAAVFTRSGPAARAFTRAVSAGMVGVNVPIPVPVSHFSFGGWKDSLFGDTHMQGPQGVHFWTRAKVVTSRWPQAAAGLNLAMPTTH